MKGENTIARPGDAPLRKDNMWDCEWLTKSGTNWKLISCLKNGQIQFLETHNILITLLPDEDKQLAVKMSQF